MNKRGYEFSFAWIFTLIVGAAIIFLAIYAAFQFSDSLRFGRDSATAKKIGVLLTPLETNLESGKSYPLLVSEETTIFNGCVEPSVTNFFGSQEISVAIKSQIAKDDDGEVPGVKSRFNNKYVFSDNRTTGKKEFYVLSKPFHYPFKIADLTILWSDQEEYCFVEPDINIQREINDLGLQNISIVNETCDDKINVCFNGESCEIEVSGRSVTKQGITVKYTESTRTDDKYALLFAAIFSDPKEYNCQLHRLAARAESLAKLNLQKSINLGSDGCSPIRDDLETYIDSAVALKGTSISDDLNGAPSPDFAQIDPTDLKTKNALCKRF